MFWQTYERISNELDREYKIPDDSHIKKMEFDKMRWKNAKTKNFLMIMKVLAKQGPCTIKEIVEKDGLPIKNRGGKTSRVDVYNRIINGDGEKIPGLIKREIIVEDKSVLTSKPTRTYKLSLFGILYAIRIFSEKYPSESRFYIEPKIRDRYIFQDNFNVIPILDVLAVNYHDSLPLIFGKWDTLKKEFFIMVNNLVALAHGIGIINNDLQIQAIFNTRAFELPGGWSNVQTPFADELTLWFFSLIVLNIPFGQARTILSKDKDIFDWYMKFLSSLSKAEKERSLRMKLQWYLLNGNQELAEKTLKQVNSIQN